MISIPASLWNESPALPLAFIGWSYLGYAFALHAFAITTPPVCLFLLLTGTPCPLCGMTRAFGALMGGDAANALALNHLSLPVFAAWIAMTVGLTTASIAKGALFWRMTNQRRSQ